jgi:hypothetical protein
MRKSCSQITLNMPLAYFIALTVTIVFSSVSVSKANAQTNGISLYETSRVHNANTLPVTTMGKDLLMDKIMEEGNKEMEFNIDFTYDLVRISFNKKIINIVVYDLDNRVVEDVTFDINQKKIDFSASCPGVYYIRVDYQEGCQLKRIEIL